MAKGFKRGASGSNPLNFRVKTYPSETELKADKPKENTIGVITTTTMSSWVFSATEPTDPEAGMVWISVGGSGSVEFNALKKNTLQVYPLFAKQYVTGAWADVTAKSYHGSVWVEWWSGELYDSGDECAYVTGGWEIVPSIYDGGGTLTKNANNIHASDPNQYKPLISTVNPIDFTRFTTLYFEGESEENGNYGFIYVHPNKANLSGAPIDGAWIYGYDNVDISALEGSYYISVGTYNGHWHTYSKIYLK